ncbi:squamous cell carcinoma antigen recognized by T-cells 3-like isoform X2 [Anneissia japonica]|uniref:squamous cell carcinoma antigen recognized by T-cells 3-like isoform X2 n=1 Tax=Anneissia japonica TaxID=1529436 RepID=UPI0014259406|nr:squamous cell carcinoma antigen recognized by T-cells 3-like isoform X2 [Anneissia japonica]
MEETMELEGKTNVGASDSESSDDEDNLVQEKELAEKIAESPYVYDNHVKLIELMKETGELEKLRDARNAMAKIFPLSEDLWLEWVQDEVKLASSEDDKQMVLEVLDRAVSDYLSVDLWLEYCQFTIGGIGTDVGLAKARDTYESAVRVAGLHVTRGSLIWDSYRVFENAILQSLQPQIGAVQTSDQQKKLQEQIERIERIFRRQLSTPLLNMEETYQEFQQFVTDGVPKDLTDKYNKALCQLKAYNKYEVALSKAESPRLAEYENYIRAIKSKGDVGRLQCLYERALVENWQNPAMWKAYTEAMDDDYRANHEKVLKDDENKFYRYHQSLGSKETRQDIQTTDEDMKVDSSLQKSDEGGTEEERNQIDDQSLLMIHKRAVRNCSWSAALWVGYLQTLERVKQSHSEIQGVFEDAILAGFSSSGEYLDVWTSYLNYLKRRIEWKTGGAPLQEFRDTAQRAIDFLSRYFGDQGDELCTLQRYWAKVETHYNNNLECGREQWSKILESNNGYKAEYWLEYYQFELKYGDLQTCREVLQQAVDLETDWPQKICETLLNFEREYGSLNSYEEAVCKVQAILEAAEKYRAKAAKKAEKKFSKGGNKNWQSKSKPDYEGRVQSEWKKQEVIGKEGQEAQKRGKGKKNKARKKRERQKSNEKTEEGSIETSKRESTKRKAETEPEVSAKQAKLDEEGFKVPTLLMSPTPKSPTKSAQKQAPVMQPPPITQPPPEPTSSKEVIKDNTTETLPKEAGHSYNDNLTVFVKNLSYNITDEKIRSVFNQCGEITDVRMKVGNKNKFRGFCYVEFKDEASVVKALQLDRHEIDGRPLYVDPSVDKSKGDKPKAKQFKWDTGLDQKKLFISGLPRTTTKEDLQEMFAKYGTVKDVRIVTYRSGVPKGLAFVEYEKESEASSAVLGADGTVIGEHTIAVAISNPPSRKPPSDSTYKNCETNN